MVQYTRLQWVTGIRYLAATFPFFFLAAVPVLLRLPRALVASIAVLSVTINWSIAMVRSQGSVGQNLARVFVEGLQLPWLTVLSKTRAQYLPWLEGHPSPLGWFALWAVMIWLLWRLERPFWRWSVPPP